MEFTSDPLHACIITGDNSTDSQRARMACGHFISCEGMHLYVKNVLENGGHSFICPHQDYLDLQQVCGGEWSWEMVRRVAQFTDEEISKVEYDIGKNYLTKQMGAKYCPGCRFIVTKSKLSTCKQTACPICSHDTSTYVFCWQCEREWKSPPGEVNSCGNPGCDTDDNESLSNYLENGYHPDGRTVIGHLDSCPSVRACPACGIIINHDGGCQFVRCEECKHLFCFICLSPGDKCTPVTCDVAPLQKIR